MGPYRSFTGTSDTRDATIAAILDQAPAEMTPGELVAAAAAYRIVLTLEDAASRIYTHTARRAK